MSKVYKVSPETRQQIVERIKNEGIPISQAATEHGISTTTIYKWLGKSVTTGPSWLEFNKLKQENRMLLEVVGKLTIDLTISKKKISSV